jgi:hypothetical protein
VNQSGLASGAAPPTELLGLTKQLEHERALTLARRLLELGYVPLTVQVELALPIEGGADWKVTLFRVASDSEKPLAAHRAPASWEQEFFVRFSGKRIGAEG